MALKGIVVVEMAGIAPVPFVGMVLCDFGARVIRIDPPRGLFMADLTSPLHTGKEHLTLDLKTGEGKEELKGKVREADIFLDAYRPGVMEKLGLGPDVLLALNPRLIYARLSGYGQKGDMSHVAGHDINYIAMSGILSLLGKDGSPPAFPANLLGDFGGGSLLCLVGILIALLERHKSNRGQVVDQAISKGVTYLSTFATHHLSTSLWNQPRGNNLLDGGAPFYNVYETADGGYLAVGCIEPRFYRNFMKMVGLSDENQMDRSQWRRRAEEIGEKIKGRKRGEWEKEIKGKEVCVTPVLSVEELSQHEWVRSDDYVEGGVPTPQPVLSRTPGRKWRSRL